MGGEYPRVYNIIIVRATMTALLGGYANRLGPPPPNDAYPNVVAMNVGTLGRDAPPVNSVPGNVRNTILQRVIMDPNAMQNDDDYRIAGAELRAITPVAVNLAAQVDTNVYVPTVYTSNVMLIGGRNRLVSQSFVDYIPENDYAETLVQPMVQSDHAQRDYAITWNSNAIRLTARVRMCAIFGQNGAYQTFMNDYAHRPGFMYPIHDHDLERRLVPAQVQGAAAARVMLRYSYHVAVIQSTPASREKQAGREPRHQAPIWHSVDGMCPE